MFKGMVNRYRNILHLRFQPAFTSIPPDALNKISPNSFLQRFIKICLYTGGRLLTNIFGTVEKKDVISGKIWLYVVSQNNVDALQFLRYGLHGTVFVAGQKKQIGRYNHLVNRLSLRWKFVYTAFYFFPVLIGLYKMYGVRSIRFFDLIFISIGYYEQYIKQLKKYQPKAIVLSNDHNDDARAMLLAAKKCSIPTIYIQHATVSPAFPPLEFDLSLLEGQDAMDKYRQCGPVSGEVKLIGMPKADNYLKNRSFKNTIETIGICGNLLDNYDGLKISIFTLSKQFSDLKFIFRPHPGDTRDFSFLRTHLPNLISSDPKTETAFDFLKHTDLLIAADSSIHLEAAFLNIPSVYFRFGESNFNRDYYGYVAKGLIPKADTSKELTELIQQIRNKKPEVFRKTAYYNAVAGTEMEGKSSELVIKEIVAFLKINQ